MDVGACAARPLDAATSPVARRSGVAGVDTSDAATSPLATSPWWHGGCFIAGMHLVAKTLSVSFLVSAAIACSGADDGGVARAEPAPPAACASCQSDCSAAGGE